MARRRPRHQGQGELSDIEEDVHDRTMATMRARYFHAWKWFMLLRWLRRINMPSSLDPAIQAQYDVESSDSE